MSRLPLSNKRIRTEIRSQIAEILAFKVVRYSRTESRNNCRNRDYYRTLISLAESVSSTSENRICIDFVLKNVQIEMNSVEFEMENVEFEMESVEFHVEMVYKHKGCVKVENK